MPVDGSSHDEGSYADALGRDPITYWVGPPKGDTATAYEYAGTLGMPRALTEAAVGLIAISVGTKEVLRVPVAPPSSLPWSPPAPAELASGQYPCVPDPGPRTVTWLVTRAPLPTHAGSVHPDPSTALFE